LRRDSQIVSWIVNAWEIHHDPEIVLNIFLKEQKNLSDERFWELMRTVWILAGSVEHAPKFRNLMQSSRPQRFYFSTPEEAKFLRELPEWFDVYRATNSMEDGGLSWTLSKEYAQWYKQAYEKKLILSRLIKRSEVFAYIDRNKESEIILL